MKPLLLDLRKNRYEICPTKTPCTPFKGIMIKTAPPRFRTLACSFQGGVKNASVKCSKSLTDFSVFLEVNEVANPCTHLAFALFNEKSLGSTHKGRTRGESDTPNVSSDKSVIGSGGDNLFHNVSVLIVKLIVVMLQEQPYIYS